MQKGKVVIVGAGSVGATIAYACLIQGVTHQIALYDIDAKKVEAEGLDLSHGLQFVPPATVKAGDDIELCQGAQVVVITAGAKSKPGQSRLELAGTNTKMLVELLPKLMKAAPDALLLVVSNPVDVLTHVAQAVSGYDRSRVVGSGTVLDSSRFRHLIAQRCRVAEASVHGYIVGEHGDSAIPLWSSAMIAGLPLHSWAVPGHGKLGVRDRVEISQGVKESSQTVIAGKGMTQYAIGLATASILRAILNDESRVLPVSTRVDGVEGMEGVSLSLPCVVGAKGAEAPLPLILNDAERAGLAASAQTLKAAAKSVGF